MEGLKVKAPGTAMWDAASLGEIMLRLDPGDGRIHTARDFKVWEGGGEYNVVRGLRRCFGLKTTAVTAFADNPVGRLVEDFMLQGGVDTSHVKWVPYDGIGRTVRNGLNFVERGFGCRGARSCADRGLTAVSQLRQVVPHGRHICRALRDDGRRRDRGAQGREEARHRHELRPQLPRLSLEVHWRPGEGASR